MLQTFFWYPSPDLCLDTILSLSSTDNSFHLLAWVLLWHALSTVSTDMDVCVFPNHVQSSEFTTGGHLKDDQWKQDAPEFNFESYSKGSEYLCK
jgi:hypothetical protein